MTRRLDYYKVLGVDRDAQAEAIHRAYRLLARAHHPDRNPGAEAAAHMSLLNEAYACLGDAGRRRAYDQNAGVSEPPALQEAVLDAARELLDKSGWRRMDGAAGDAVYARGLRRVHVRLSAALGPAELDRWRHAVDRVLRQGQADCAVLAAFRLTGAGDIDRALGALPRPALVIELVESRVLGVFPDSDFEDLFRPFLGSER